VRSALSSHDHVVSSVFVNPAQFAAHEDLGSYPRQLERDAELLGREGVRLIFAPDEKEMYGPGYNSVVDVPGFLRTREGMARPKFFTGVVTVCTKLFNIVRPDAAYFGQKDAAQCAAIRRVVQDLNMDLDVVVGPTVREADGLAMSSRNAYLSPEERKAAPAVHRSLRAGRALWRERVRAGPVAAADIRAAVAAELEGEPLIGEVQYVSVDDPETMEPLEEVGEAGCNVSLAVKCGKVRLIDNEDYKAPLPPPAPDV
jgi:pantoate--beta-alanine ligase